jgi:hypothetical protein
MFLRRRQGKADSALALMTLGFLAPESEADSRISSALPIGSSSSLT